MHHYFTLTFILCNTVTFFVFISLCRSYLHIYLFCADDSTDVVNKEIGDVLISVNAEFIAEHIIDEDNAVHQDSAGSLELSESQSQPFDPLEPPTQPGEHAAAQVEADKQKQAEKVERARQRRAESERRSKANSERLSKPDVSEPALFVQEQQPPSNADPVVQKQEPSFGDPLVEKKGRSAVRKFKASECTTPRRSPRVPSAALNSEGTRRHSPRVLQMKNANAPPAGKSKAPAAAANAKVPAVPKAKAPAAAKANAPAAPNSKAPAAAKSKAKAKSGHVEKKGAGREKMSASVVKKLPSKRRRAVSFDEDDDDFVDEMLHVSEESDDADDDISQVMVLFTCTVLFFVLYYQ